MLLLASGALLGASGGGEPLPAGSPAVTRAVPPAPPEAVVVGPPLAAPAPTPAGSVATTVAPVVDPEAAPPTRVVVPGIGVDSPLVGLRRQRDGTLEVPSDFAVAGWHRSGTRPGDTGPAVLVGHVDSYEGPAVFFRLGELADGDRVSVTRSDASQVDFVVYAVERVPKQAFPTERVYGDTAGPELRLLTCSGRFDPRTKHYEDNTVVYARQVQP